MNGWNGWNGWNGRSGGSGGSGDRSRATRTRPPFLRRLLSARGRSLEITRAGWLLIALTLAVGFAAINSGSNLLHAVFGAQMALIIGSGMLSESVVARAKARRVAPTTLHAKTPSVIQVEIENRDPRGEVLSVSVEDDDRIRDGNACAPVFAVRIPPLAQVTLHSTVVMQRRGRHRLPAAVLATRFPFGLFVKRRDLPASAEVLVLPRIDTSALQTGQHERPGHGEAVGRVARVGEFHGLRDYREGDDPRRIYWPAFARTSRAVVREHEALGDREVILELALGRSGDPIFERAVERVASAAVAHLQEPGLCVGLLYDGELAIVPENGHEHRQRLLEYLALVGEPMADATSTAKVREVHP